jgi:hypothetical protein
MANEVQIQCRNGYELTTSVNETIFNELRQYSKTMTMIGPH